MSEQKDGTLADIVDRVFEADLARDEALDDGARRNLTVLSARRPRAQRRK